MRLCHGISVVMRPVNHINFIPVSSENDFVNRILFQDKPLAALGDSKCLLQHRIFAGIDKRWIRRVFDEIEEGLKKGVFETLGGLFLPLGIPGQKLKDVV